MIIDSIKIRAFDGGRSCHVQCDGQSFSFPFSDLFEFDRYIAELLAITEGLVSPNAITNADRELLQIESIYVQDAGEFNKRCIPGREIEGRRADGEKICGGRWYGEITMNGSATDCAFTSLEELYQITQTIIQRETRNRIALPGSITVPRVAAYG